MTKLFDFRCGAGHVFQAEGEYSQFDMARKCVEPNCREAAFMLVYQSPSFAISTMAEEQAAYMQHNVTFTGGTKEITHRPNEQALQCQCDGCRGHRKRARVTAVAEPMRRNKRVAKEVRV